MSPLLIGENAGSNGILLGIFTVVFRFHVILYDLVKLWENPIAERSAFRKIMFFAYFVEKSEIDMKSKCDSKMTSKVALESAFSPIKRGDMQLFPDILPLKTRS